MGSYGGGASGSYGGDYRGGGAGGSYSGGGGDSTRGFQDSGGGDAGGGGGSVYNAAGGTSGGGVGAYTTSPSGGGGGDQSGAGSGTAGGGGAGSGASDQAGGGGGAYTAGGGISGGGVGAYTTSPSGGGGAGGDQTGQASAAIGGAGTGPAVSGAGAGGGGGVPASVGDILSVSGGDVLGQDSLFDQPSSQEIAGGVPAGAVGEPTSGDGESPATMALSSADQSDVQNVNLTQQQMEVMRDLGFVPGMNAPGGQGMGGPNTPTRANPSDWSLPGGFPWTAPELTDPNTGLPSILPPAEQPGAAPLPEMPGASAWPMLNQSLQNLHPDLTNLPSPDMGSTPSAQQAAQQEAQFFTNPSNTLTETPAPSLSGGNPVGMFAKGSQTENIGGAPPDVSGDRIAPPGALGADLQTAMGPGSIAATPPDLSSWVAPGSEAFQSQGPAEQFAGATLGNVVGAPPSSGAPQWLSDANRPSLADINAGRVADPFAGAGGVGAMFGPFQGEGGPGEVTALGETTFGPAASPGAALGAGISAGSVNLDQPGEPLSSEFPDAPDNVSPNELGNDQLQALIDAANTQLSRIPTTTDVGTTTLPAAAQTGWVAPGSAGGNIEDLLAPSDPLAPPAAKSTLAETLFSNNPTWGTPVQSIEEVNPTPGPPNPAGGGVPSIPGPEGQLGPMFDVTGIRNPTLIGIENALGPPSPSSPAPSFPADPAWAVPAVEPGGGNPAMQGLAEIAPGTANAGIQPVATAGAGTFGSPGGLPGLPAPSGPETAIAPTPVKTVQVGSDQLPPSMQPGAQPTGGTGPTPVQTTRISPDQMPGGFGPGLPSAAEGTPAAAPTLAPPSGGAPGSLLQTAAADSGVSPDQAHMIAQAAFSGQLDASHISQVPQPLVSAFVQSVTQGAAPAVQQAASQLSADQQRQVAAFDLGLLNEWRQVFLTQGIPNPEQSPQWSQVLTMVQGQTSQYVLQLTGKQATQATLQQALQAA